MYLSLFDRSGHITNSFINAGQPCLSLDIFPGYNGYVVDICTDIMSWDYKAYKKDYFKFIFIALPCQAYSIASGGRHFKRGKIQSSQAVYHVNLLIRVYQITQYFGCKFMIENPSGGLINNVFFKSFFSLNVTRLTMSNFGFATRKQTDLFYNFDMLLITPVSYRVNGRYNVKKLANMSFSQKVTYPVAFADFIAQNVLKNI